MKKIIKSNFMRLLSSFLTSAILSAVSVVAVKCYIAFAEQTAGSYSIAMIFGNSLRDFLIKALLIIAGVLAFTTFAVQVKKYKTPKKLYPFYVLGMGALWIALPLISAYSISRFTGNLTVQSVAGIAIISNVVFMMISICCGIIAVIDVIYNLFMPCENSSKANRCAALLTGIPTGCGFALLFASVLQPLIGLSGVFVVFGVITVIIGIVNLFYYKAD